MFASRKLNPTAHLAFLTLWTAGAGIGLLASFVFLVGNILGGNATATVGHVYSQVGYTVTFTTKFGVDCETSQKWSPSPSLVRSGDTIEVQYSRISPCDNVKRTDDFFALYGFPAIPAIMVVAGSVAIARLRRDRRRARGTP